MPEFSSPDAAMIGSEAMQPASGKCSQSRDDDLGVRQ
jgi:hypothetical protein